MNDHENDIATFERQDRTGDRRTAALARTQLPTLAVGIKEGRCAALADLQDRST